MSLGSRIQQARQAKKLSQSDLGKIVGKGKSVISNWEKDINKPNADLIFQICDALEVEPNWLMEYESDDSLSPDEQSVIDMYRKLTPYDQETVRHHLQRMVNRPDLPTRDLDLYYLRPSAGSGNFMLDDATKEKVSIPIQKWNRNADYAVIVDGHSMEPRLKDGELLYIQKTSDIDVGEIGVFLVDGEAVVKQKADNCLHSINPAYPDIKIYDWTEIRCLGKVLNK